jgi:beta-glucosidase/6-phospho-beta-glucosidase/beta-galactosidase
VLSSLAKFGKPIMISENGIADANDARRAAYTVDHLRQVTRAIEAGINIRGYVHWSLLDNFEWCDGYSQRFGLAHVDFSSPETTRRLRPSARV